MAKYRSNEFYRKKLLKQRYKRLQQKYSFDPVYYKELNIHFKINAKSWFRMYMNHVISVTPHVSYRISKINQKYYLKPYNN